MNEDDAKTNATLKSEVSALRQRNADLEQQLAAMHQVEAALRESESRYRAIVEDQTELIARYRGDHTFTFVNAAYCRYFGKTREELIDQNWSPVVHEEDWPIVEKQLAALGPDHPVVVCECRIHVGDEIRWQRWTNRALLDDAGRVVEVQAVGVDVTERREAEEEARRLNAELERRVAEKTQALQEVIRELSTPLIPVADQVIAMPLIGILDSARAAAALETLLQGVVAHRARTVVLDVTGVGIVDSQVADALIRAAQAVRLLGAEVVLTGIQPRIAETLVALGVDVRGVVTLRSLKEGIAFALKQRGARGAA